MEPISINNIKQQIINHEQNNMINSARTESVLTQILTIFNDHSWQGCVKFAIIFCCQFIKMSQKIDHDDSFVVNSDFQQCQSQNYDVVTFDARIKLIKLVCAEGYKINKAASVLGINQSTAKYIVRSFRNKGKILMKSAKHQQLSQNQLQQLQQLQARCLDKKKCEKQKKTNIQSKTIKSKKINNKKAKSEQKIQIEGQMRQKKEVQVMNSSENNLELACNQQFVFVPIMFNPYGQYNWALAQNICPI